MHIALKKIKYDLIRFLPKGDEDQIKEIYNIVKEEYDKLGVAVAAKTKRRKVNG